MFSQLLRVACAATLLFAAATSAQAATISLMPSAAAVNVGDTFTIDINAADLNLGAFELTIGFQPARVALLGDPEFFGFLGGGLPSGLQAGAAGIDTAELDETSFLDVTDLLALQGTAPGNGFLLGRLTFRAESTGVADFGFLFDYLTNVEGTAQIAANLTGTSVTVGMPASTVPEPSSVMLAGASLLGVAAFCRCRRK